MMLLLGRRSVMDAQPPKDTEPLPWERARQKELRRLALQQWRSDRPSWCRHDRIEERSCARCRIKFSACGCEAIKVPPNHRTGSFHLCRGCCMIFVESCFCIHHTVGTTYFGRFIAPSRDGSGVICSVSPCGIFGEVLVGTVDPDGGRVRCGVDNHDGANDEPADPMGPWFDVPRLAGLGVWPVVWALVGVSPKAFSDLLAYLKDHPEHIRDVYLASVLLQDTPRFPADASESVPAIIKVLEDNAVAARALEAAVAEGCNSRELIVGIASAICGIKMRG